MGTLALGWSIDEIKRSEYRVPLAAAIAAGDAASAEAMTRAAMRAPVDAFGDNVGDAAAPQAVAPQTPRSPRRRTAR
jgi:hypothetical protein